MELVKRCDVGIHRSSLWSFCILTVLASTQNLRHWVSACWEARLDVLGISHFACRCCGVTQVLWAAIPVQQEKDTFQACLHTTIVPKDPPPQQKHSIKQLPHPELITRGIYLVYIYFWVLGNWNDSPSRCTSLWIQDMDAGTSSCGRCPAGTWNNGSSSVCNQCPAGTWSSEDMEWRSGCMQVLDVY